MAAGLLDTPVWGCVIYTLVVTHITIVTVTVFLHRYQAHRALDLHPAIEHFFRFWLWLTTGMVTRQWVAVHRKHHACVETKDDPHSPQVYGIKKLLLEGTELYRVGTKDQETLEKYGHGTPDDWIERNVYTKHGKFGVGSMLVIDVLLFGPLGLTVWAVQMLWIPIFAAGIVNGLGHYWGYRNFECPDASTNISPWGILIGGEELHNNHHAFASSARLSSKWWEFDIGWMYIKIFALLGLARVKKLAPQPVLAIGKDGLDVDTVRAIIANHLHIMARYAREVVGQVHKEELRKATGDVRDVLKATKGWLTREDSRLNDDAKDHLARAFLHSHPLETVYEFKVQLQRLWQERTASYESLLAALQVWCRQAEQTGIKALQEFAQSLRGYTLQPA
ncbi:MAG: transposase [Gammaproteobacteria bacterium]|nr:transposase [Gammaproteobacteria bacterium]